MKMKNKYLLYPVYQIKLKTEKKKYIQNDNFYTGKLVRHNIFLYILTLELAIIYTIQVAVLETVVYYCKVYF